MPAKGCKKRGVEDVEDAMSIDSTDLELGQSDTRAGLHLGSHLSAETESMLEDEHVIEDDGGEEGCEKSEGSGDDYSCEDEDNVDNFIKAAVKDIGAFSKDESAGGRHALFSSSSSSMAGGSSKSRCVLYL